MSNPTSHVRSTWLAVEGTLRRKTVVCKGTPLTPADRDTYIRSLVLWCLLCIDLRVRYDEIAGETELVRWVHYMCSLDVSVVSNALSAIVVGVRSTHAPTTWNRFKSQYLTGIPECRKVVAPIRRIFDGFLQEPHAVSFDVCYQFLSFIQHVTLADVVFDTVQPYVALERDMVDFTYSETYVEELNSIMREWLYGMDMYSHPAIHPSHGPGGTATVPRTAPPALKTADLAVQKSIERHCIRSAKRTGRDLDDLLAKHGLATCKLIDVPKSLTARRTISLEPTLRQYRQQMVFRAFDMHFRRSSLHRHITLHKQEASGELAQAGSRDQSFATIDLSAASDRVSVVLVQRVFEGTCVAQSLLDQRSTRVKVGKRLTIQLRKFAPMGSSVCFPVQTLLFAAIVELAMRRAYREWKSFPDVYRVYGDDIIVHDELYEDVVRLLESLNFKVNNAKSYHAPSRFREACGMHAYDGVDCTPLRIPRGYVAVTASNPWSASSYDGALSLINACRERDLRHTRSFLMHSLMQQRAHPPLFSRDGLGGIATPYPTNHRALHRWHEDWQCDMIRVTVTKSVPRGPVKVGEIDALNHWLRTAHYTRIEWCDSRGPIWFDEILTVERRRLVDLLSYDWVANPVE